MANTAAAVSLLTGGSRCFNQSSAIVEAKEVGEEVGEEVAGRTMGNQTGSVNTVGMRTMPHVKSAICASAASRDLKADPWLLETGSAPPVVTTTTHLESRATCDAVESLGRALP